LQCYLLYILSAVTFYAHHYMKYNILHKIERMSTSLTAFNPRQLKGCTKGIKLPFNKQSFLCGNLL